MKEAVRQRIANLHERLRSTSSEAEEQRGQLENALEVNKKTLEQLSQATIRIENLQQQVGHLTDEVVFNYATKDLIPLLALLIVV